MHFNRLIGLAIAASTLCAGVPVIAQNTMPGPAATSAQNTPIVDPGRIYNDKHPYEWVGKWVTLQNVLVQDTNDSGNFWVGSDDDHRLLIVKPRTNADLKAIHVKKGDLVTISGVVRPASKYMQKKTTAESDSMNDAKDSSGVFLMADTIRVTSSSKH